MPSKGVLEAGRGPSYLRVTTPANLEIALEGLVRKVLKEQPKQEDIYAFAADYFENLVEIRDKAENPNLGVHEICPNRSEAEANDLIKLATSFAKPSFLTHKTVNETEELCTVVDIDQIRGKPEDSNQDAEEPSLENEEHPLAEVSDEQEVRIYDNPVDIQSDEIVNGENPENSETTPFENEGELSTPNDDALEASEIEPNETSEENKEQTSEQDENPIESDSQVENIPDDLITNSTKAELIQEPETVHTDVPEETTEPDDVITVDSNVEPDIVKTDPDPGITNDNTPAEPESKNENTESGTPVEPEDTPEEHAPKELEKTAEETPAVEVTSTETENETPAEVVPPEAAEEESVNLSGIEDTAEASAEEATPLEASSDEITQLEVPDETPSTVDESPVEPKTVEASSDEITQVPDETLSTVDEGSVELKTAEPSSDETPSTVDEGSAELKTVEASSEEITQPEVPDETPSTIDEGSVEPTAVDEIPTEEKVQPEVTAVATTEDEKTESSLPEETAPAETEDTPVEPSITEATSENLQDEPSVIQNDSSQPEQTPPIELEATSLTTTEESIPTVSITEAAEEVLEDETTETVLSEHEVAASDLPITSEISDKPETSDDASKSADLILAETGETESPKESVERDIIKEFIEREQEFSTMGNSTRSLEAVQVHVEDTQSELSLTANSETNEETSTGLIGGTLIENSVFEEEPVEKSVGGIIGGVSTISTSDEIIENTGTSEETSTGLIGGTLIENSAFEEESVEKSVGGIIGGVNTISTPNEIIETTLTSEEPVTANLTEEISKENEMSDNVTNADAESPIIAEEKTLLTTEISQDTIDLPSVVEQASAVVDDVLQEAIKEEENDPLKDESGSNHSRSSKDSESLEEENPFISAEVTTLVQAQSPTIAETESQEDEDDVITPLNAEIGTIQEMDEGKWDTQIAMARAAVIIQKNFRKFLQRKKNNTSLEGSLDIGKESSASTDSSLSSSATKIQQSHTIESSKSDATNSFNEPKLVKTKAKSMSTVPDSEVWGALEQELEESGNTQQNSNRQKLRREDAVQITTTTSEDSGSGSPKKEQLLGGGELHDMIIPEE